jgi:protein phosphatase
MHTEKQISVARPQEIFRSDHPANGETLYISSSLRCHPGSVRVENQDRIARFTVSLGELFLIADGVGGQKGGGKAATLAVEEYCRALSVAPSTANPVEALQKATTSVSEHIAEAKESGDPTLQGMASTIALVLIHQRTAYVGHIGDTRVYLARNGTLSSLTRDHSVVGNMVAHGILSEEEAQAHPNSHILTRSLGLSDASLEINSHDLEEGDVLLMCSDGLWSYVPHRKIADTITSFALDTIASADTLLELALAAGGPDNISITLLSVDKDSQKLVELHLSPKKIKRARTFFLYAILIITVLAAIALIWIYFGSSL